MSELRGEAAVIAASTRPMTRDLLAAGLIEMGLRAGDLIIMHTRISALGWVPGGAQSVLEAVFDVIGSDGTLVTPGFSSQLSDPINWNSPPIPQDWIEPVRAGMPVFDAAKTPTRGVGQLPELFRKWPGTVRSTHPFDSFLANGPLAPEIIANHPTESSLGPASPLGHLYERQAKILMLGAGFGSCTSFHLAEHDLPGHAATAYTFPAHRDGNATVWAQANNPPTFENLFDQIGTNLVGARDVSQGFGDAAKLFDMASAVDFARDWLINADLTSAND